VCKGVGYVVCKRVCVCVGGSGVGCVGGGVLGGGVWEGVGVVWSMNAWSQRCCTALNCPSTRHPCLPNQCHGEMVSHGPYRNTSQAGSMICLQSVGKWDVAPQELSSACLALEMQTVLMA